MPGTESKTRRSDQADRRKAQILHAALRCCATKGFSAMTMDDVAQTARLSKGLPFYYFKSKQKLCLAMIELFSERVGHRALEILQASGPEHVMLRDLAWTFVEALTVECKHPQLTIEFWALALRDREVAQRLQGIRDRTQASMVEILRRGAQDGAPRGQSAELIAGSLYSALVGIASQWVLTGGAFDPRRAVEVVVSHLPEERPTPAADGGTS